MSGIIEIVKEITDNSDIKSVFFVGCGASRADLYPAFYFLNRHARVLRTSIHTAGEFVLAAPAAVDETAVVVTCSLGGNTPESVEAAAWARNRGAHVIAVTHEAGSAMTQSADYPVIFDWNDAYSSKMDKMIKVLKLAVELLHSTEGYEYYDKMNRGFDIVYDLIDESVKSVKKDAEHFAEEYKDVPLLYVTSSGAMQEVAWAFSACLMMEMQWIPSSTFNDGDFFHGPFEMVEEGVPYLLLINEGSTREMDVRTLEFLQRFRARVTVVDGKDFGLSNYFAKEVVDYFNPIVLSPVLRVYAEQLAVARSHPLTKRRYMWKLKY